MSLANASEYDPLPGCCDTSVQLEAPSARSLAEHLKIPPALSCAKASIHTSDPLGSKVIDPPRPRVVGVRPLVVTAAQVAPQSLDL